MTALATLLPCGSHRHSVDHLLQQRSVVRPVQLRVLRLVVFLREKKRSDVRIHVYQVKGRILCTDHIFKILIILLDQLRFKYIYNSIYIYWLVSKGSDSVCFLEVVLFNNKLKSLVLISVIFGTYAVI